MKLHLEITLLCIINIIWIRHTFCASELPTKSHVNEWTCSCLIAQHEKSNFIPANCSSSCDCSPAAGGSSGNRWTCICSNGGLPKLAGDDNDGSCFTACNCKAGILSELQTPKKRFPSKAVVIVILVFVIFTGLVFVASLLCYGYRKDKRPIQCASSSSDRLTSCSTATNNTSLTTSSLPLYKGYVVPSSKPCMGCIPRPSFMFRSRMGAIHGTIIQFPYSELENATQRFSEEKLIGIGGSSRVYRGNLRDGRTVAIKRMKFQVGLDAEHIFLTEIELISRLHHCHVVPLLGYCSEHQGKHAERLLVFEYIPNGNLRVCLDGDLGQRLDWSTRVAIALGAARGLEYLHVAAAPKILHRDVKSTNILLDEKWRAKITDLGMAKHLQNDGIPSCSNSPARMQGTFGYFAPEYAIVGRATLKSDVFSFGVVLLELITGRKPIFKSSNKGEESLVIWATPFLHDSKKVITELPDPRLNSNFEEEEMQVVAYLAKECLLLDPDSRPTMTEVVQILSSIAPDKSKRKDLPMRAFQRPSAGGMRIEYPDISDGELSCSSESEDIKQITSENPGRPSSCFTDNEKEGDDSSNDAEKLMLLTSKCRSCHLQDDEVVDLTEPRFESFCMPNVDSHVVKIK